MTAPSHTSAAPPAVTSATPSTAPRAHAASGDAQANASTNTNAPAPEAASGAIFALLAYGSWGLVPLYWRMLKHIPAPEILSHRVVWSSALLLVLVGRRAGGFSALREAARSRKAMAVAVASALLIGANWGIYLYAVTGGHVLESSLGYFINPLVNVVLGMAFLREKPTRAQAVALAFAGAGVANLVLGAGVFPWIALSLSLTFGFYGLVRKVSPLPALQGSTLESLVLTPLAICYLVWLARSGGGHFTSEGLATPLLLAAGGAVTALPLLWFSEAARRMKLTVLGFFQFLSPTLQFLLAVTVFGEPFTKSHAVTFGFIWIALVINVSAAMRARGRSGART